MGNHEEGGWGEAWVNHHSSWQQVLSQPLLWWRVTTDLKFSWWQSLSLHDLVTHADPTTSTRPTGPVDRGTSTSKEVPSRMTSLEKQTYTPGGVGKEMHVHSWAGEAALETAGQEGKTDG